MWSCISILLIHDRESMFSKQLDEDVTAMGVRVLRTPVRTPKANSMCERFGGTLRRECPNFLIPLNERHLRLILKIWVGHYNRARPQMSLGPGIPAAYALPRRKALIGIVLQRNIRFDVPPLSADCTMNIGSRRWLHEARMGFLRNTGVARSRGIP